MYNQPLSDGLAFDLFDSVQKVGQDIIDTAAGAVGIEKGGAIDQAVTTAANVGRDVGVIPDVNAAADMVIDAVTGAVVPKSQASPGSRPVSTASPGVTPGSATTPGVTPPAGDQGFLEKIPAVGYGAAAGGATYLATKSFIGSAVVGVGTTILVHMMRKRPVAQLRP